MFEHSVCDRGQLDTVMKCLRLRDVEQFWWNEDVNVENVESWVRKWTWPAAAEARRDGYIIDTDPMPDLPDMVVCLITLVS